MNAVTKPFAWSYSRLKNYETCPKRHYEVDIAKSVKDDEGEALMWGNQVHEAFAKALSNGENLPPSMVPYQKWIDIVRQGVDDTNSVLLVEQQYAITKEFGKTTWFAPDVWFRTKGDVVMLNPPEAVVLDWKTGKILDDSVQLALTSQCIFTHYPEIETVQSEFIWLKDDARTTEKFTRDDMVTLWPGVYERIAPMEESARTLNYPPLPGRLCAKWCPVKTCQYWGKRI